MKFYKRFLVVFVFFFIIVCSYSQTINKEVYPLFDVLMTAEKQYGVKFTYADKTVKAVEIVPYNTTLSLYETIHYLINTTQLNFSFLTSHNILISKNNEGIKICGNLINIDTQKNIDGALIAVLNTNISTISDGNGYFELPEIKENQTLEISHILYPTIYLKASNFLNKNTCLTLSLSQKIEKLKEVILTNYLTTGITIRTDNSISINIKKFGILPGLIEPDVLHGLQSIPGISSVNETISTINIRGGANDQNSLIWDGIKMYHSGHFFGLISAFNPYLIDDVTIIKNGTSVQYNDAVSGTINMNTVNTIKEKPFGGAGFNLLSVDAYGQIPISEKTAIQFSGRRSITDILKTPTFEQYFKRAFQDSKISTQLNVNTAEVKTNSDFNFYDFNLKFLYNFNNKHKLRVNLLKVENNLDYNEALNNETLNISKTSVLQQKNLAFGVQYSSKWSKNFKTLVNAYYTKYNIKASNHTLLTEQRLLQNNEVLETGVKLNTYYQLNDNIKLLAGYHFYELGISNSEDVNLPLFIRTVKDVIRNHSVFSEINYTSKNNKIFIKSGLRINYIEKFGSFNAEPRIQTLFKINSNLSLKIAGEFKSQNAVQVIDLQEDFLGVEKRRWVLADNGAMPILKSKQASIGLNYERNNFFIDIEGFYKTVNGITTSNQGFQNQNQFVKTSGSYLVHGVEFLVNKKTNSYSTWLSYTYNKNNYKFKLLSPSIFPNNLDIRHAISFGNTYTYKNLNVALGIQWRTGKPNTIPIKDNAVNDSEGIIAINYNTPNSERLSSYFRADFSSTYKFNLSDKLNALVGVSLLNILDTQNVLNTYYKVNSENTVNTINNLSIGATPNVTFRVSF
ncbi:MAG: TonB-dependent receptor [Lutibacter sp.]|nr:MAG: TonB-dependent receptor [Lutibacter sp.]